MISEEAKQAVLAVVKALRADNEAATQAAVAALYKLDDTDVIEAALAIIHDLEEAASRKGRVIFAYAIPDGCGNHLRLTVQAESRELADKIVRHEIGHAGRKGYDFPFVDAKVVDVTKEPLLVKELWDHELGDSVNY